MAESTMHRRGTLLSLGQTEEVGEEVPAYSLSVD